MENSQNRVFALPVFKTFLVGMPGAGKSHWGERVAGCYALPFFDLDSYISINFGLSVALLFEKYGENGFREIEHASLQQVIDEAGPGAVIACGGGTPCFYDNMQLMKEAGKVIYIAADPAFLANNILHDSTLRPLFNDSGTLPAQIKQLLAQRRHCYEQADHILQAGDISLATFAQILYNV